MCGVMSWSWSNPSQDEALEAYTYYKGKYEDAATQKRASEQQEQSYIAERNTANCQITALSAEKINLEKRVQGIEKIIRMLEGTGNIFSVDVPAAIDRAKKTLSRADDSLRKSMRLSGGGTAASLETAFALKTVEENAHSASALLAFKAEKERLEQAIEEMHAQLANLESLVESLTGKINTCNLSQEALQSSMSSYAYDMNHYKKFTY